MNLTKLFVALSLFLLLCSMGVFSNSGSAEQSSPVKIIFDGKNATVNIEVNGTHYFTLSFSHIYMGTPAHSSPIFKNMMKEDLSHMHVKIKRSYSEKMGNYTEVLMWKNMKSGPQGFFHKKANVNVTIRFYLAEKEYYKNDVRVKRNMLRYDVLIFTDSPLPFFYLEENIKSKKNNGSEEVYEYSHEAQGAWKKLGKSAEPREHTFGGDHLGMIKFGRGSDAIECLWEYSSDVNTFYSYSDSELHLIFSFRNENGSIIYDPYISLPVPLSPSLKPIVGGVEEAVNYIMDHFLSFSIGLVMATVLVLLTPMIRKSRKQ